MRPVAVVGFAQSLHAPGETDSAGAVELLTPVITAALADAGLRRDQIGFTCSGSCDYLVGAPFSFVEALDAVGAWPPIQESHVEQDAAWALYEAWVRLQHGDIDAALVYGFGKCSLGDVTEILTLQLDPYYLAPLWPDTVSIAALQARAYLEAAGRTERDLADVVARSRDHAARNAAVPPARAGNGSVVTPLGPADCPPVTDGAAAIVLAAGDLARDAAANPAWITGIDHRIEAHSLGARDLTRSASTERAARVAGVGAGPVDVAEVHACFSHEELILRDALGLADDVTVNPSGGALAREPGDGDRPDPDRRGGPPDPGRHRRPGGRAREFRPVPATQPGLRAGRSPLMANRCAVVGVGQTEHRAARKDVSIAGLVREAALRALADAELTWADIDAVVIGKAPDMFEGVIMPELYLADALGAVGKPMMRVHTAGSVGGSTALVGASLIQAGIHQRVLVCAFEKQSESNATWALTVSQPFQAPLVAGAGGFFAPLIRAYMRRSGAPDHIGMLVAVKDRLHALRNPYAHLKLEGIDLAMVEASPMLWEPLRYLETCPSSDGACAMVLAGEDAAKQSPRPPAWVHGAAMRSEPTMFAGRDQVSPRAGRDCAAEVYRQAGIIEPRRDLDCAEVYVPFSWFEPMWLENLGFCAEGDGWKLTELGATAAGGDIPWNPSGGVLSTNPIGASGMLRFAEAAQQVRGQAGGCQVDGARLALGHAYGGGSQFFAMWVVGAAKP